MTTPPKNRWARKPKQSSRDALKQNSGPTQNYWVIGKDGKRRGPAALNRDGVKVMESRGAQCIPLAKGEFWTTELRPES